MFSKQWQRQQNFITHATLALIWGLPLLFFEFNWSTAQKLGVIAVCLAITIPTSLWLHRRLAKKFIRVYKCDYEQASRIVQRALNAANQPFSKRLMHDDEQVDFEIRSGNIRLTVGAFLLNMPLDDHLTPEIASLLTLSPLTPANAEKMELIRQMLDTAFAAQGF